MNTVDRAARLAMVAHNGTNRDGEGNILYVVHPFPVVAMLKDWGFSEKTNPVTLSVAWCHYVLEDTDAPEEAIRDLDVALGPEILVVKIADRLCNTLDFLADGRPQKALEYFGYGEPLFARIPVCAHAKAIEQTRKRVLLRLDGAKTP
jgi:(p)ppGpp synthase/HD superfamily hydrolase